MSPCHPFKENIGTLYGKCFAIRTWSISHNAPNMEEEVFNKEHSLCQIYVKIDI